MHTKLMVHFTDNCWNPHGTENNNNYASTANYDINLRATEQQPKKRPSNPSLYKEREQ